MFPYLSMCYCCVLCVIRLLCNGNVAFNRINITKAHYSPSSAYMCRCVSVYSKLIEHFINGNGEKSV